MHQEYLLDEADDTGSSAGAPFVGEPTTGDGGDEAGDALRKLRSENQSLRARMKEEAREREALAAELQRLKDADLSETEKLRRQLAESDKRSEQMATALRERTIDYEVRLAAAKIGIVDPDAAARLMDRSGLEDGPDGHPTRESIERALKALAKERTWLMRPGSADAGRGNESPVSSDMNTLIRRATGRR